MRLGTKVAVAYFDQLRAALDEEATLADTISPGADFVEIGGGRKHVISYLGDFLFPPERAGSPVKTLSGGESNRLLLARLFSRPANVLVLDEPTNDLDIETLELLEALLQDYPGTLFLVSHDRAFLDNVVTQTIAWEGEGRWKEYAGGYDDWQRARRATPARCPPAAPRKRRAQKADSRSPRRKTKLSFNEARELESMPGPHRGAGARAGRARGAARRPGALPGPRRGPEGPQRAPRADRGGAAPAARALGGAGSREGRAVLTGTGARSRPRTAVA